MTRLQRNLLVPFIAFGSGCVSATATPAAPGKAYVVVGSVFGTEMFNCSARGPEPECWQVRERPRR